MKNKYALILILIISLFLTAAFTVKDGNSSIFTVGEDIKVSEDETVNGSIALVFGDMIVDGRVEGEIAVILGDVVVNGTVDGNIASIFGDISTGEKGVVKGSVASVLGEVKRSPGSIIEGEVASIEGPIHIVGGSYMPFVVISSIVGLIVFFGLSVLLLVLVPDRMTYMAEKAYFKIGRRLAIGIIAYLMFIPIIIALAISIIGLLIIPIFIAAFFITGFIGMAALKIAIGRRITGKLEGSSAPYIYLLVGSVIVFVLPFIPVLGWIVYMLAACISLGIVLDTRFGRPKVKTV